MSNHLISEVLKIEAEADNLVNEARRKADLIIASILGEIASMKASFESTYRQEMESARLRIAHLQRGEEERLKNEYEALKEKLNTLDNKTIEDAVHCVIKHMYEC